MSTAALRRALGRLRWASQEAQRCETCAHFDNDPQHLEQAFGNLTAMSSGFASVRSRDGLCRLRGLYLPAGESCPQQTA